LKADKNAEMKALEAKIKAEKAEKEAVEA